MYFGLLLDITFSMGMFLFLYSRMYVAFFVVSLISYVATFTFSRVLSHLLSFRHDCGLNTNMTLIFAIAFAMVTLYPTVISFKDICSLF